MKTLFCLFTMLCTLSTASMNAQSWQLQTNPLGTGESAMIGKIQFVSQSEGWISAGNGKLLHTTNGGSTWTIVTPEPVDTTFGWSDPAFNLCFINPSIGWIMRTKGSLSHWQGAAAYKTTNGGAIWNKMTIPQYDAGFLIQFVDESHGWIMAFDSNFVRGGIYRTTDGGTQWNLINFAANGFPYFKSATAGWLLPVSGSSITTSDSIRKTTDGGMTWTAPWGTNTQVSLDAMYFSDVNNGWVVGRGGVILHTTNGGSSWGYVTNTGLSSDYRSKAVFFLNANVGWIATDKDGENPLVLHTTNGGSSWTTQGTPVTQADGDDIYSISFWDENTGWFAADGGRIGFFSGASGIAATGDITNRFSLFQNYPNPFNPSTTIDFSIPYSGQAELKVFNTLGQEVTTLVSSSLQAGEHRITWNAAGIPSGVYFCRLRAGSFTETKKFILLQ
jgi:photosystem II stability/assembly factor-like uncharacterized protein